MQKEPIALAFVAAITVVLVGVSVPCGAVVDEPTSRPDKDFLVKASAALKAVQDKIKNDKVLSPLAKAKVVADERAATMMIQTAESWPNFPSKDQSQERGHGRLRLDAYAELPQELPCTPFVPPPGCYYGSTYLNVPGTPAKILVETTTSDPWAQRRLVRIVIKELGKAGIAASPTAPEEVDSFPRPPSASAPRAPRIDPHSGPPGATTPGGPSSAPDRKRG